jgi:hypothetical protein
MPHRAHNFVRHGVVHETARNRATSGLPKVGYFFYRDIHTLDRQPQGRR